MPRVTSIYVCVCLASLILSELSEATPGLRRRQSREAIPPQHPGNESATSEDGPVKGSLGTTTKPGSQTLEFHNPLENSVSIDATTTIEHSSTSGDFLFALSQWSNKNSKSTLDNGNTTTGNMIDHGEDGEDTGSENGGSVPLIPLDIVPPNYNNTGTKKKCYPNKCAFKPCESNQVCVMTPQCKYKCLNTESTSTNTPVFTDITVALPSESNTTLRPLFERMCDGNTMFVCIHGIVGNCSESFECLCDDGWGDDFCNKPCTLPCIHGTCVIIGTEPQCSCDYQYEGNNCEEAIPDHEERSRILAAVLSSALAVAIILIIVIPVIMWKLRVTFVLKLVYYFKEYEDEDGKTFDAYVSMTPTLNAENFVYGSLRPILENLNFKLYLQARDAPIGDAMSEIILSALERSRRTIMIVTRDYITNEWNRFEYLIAQHETLKLQQRIIPIILEDIEEDRTKMDKSLKHILDSIKCLKFPQAKPETMTSNSVELSDIQSPDSNRSADSTTYFYKSGRSSSSRISKEEQKFEKKVAKFWNHLTLTMPKKKNKENPSSDILSKLRNHASYDLTNNVLKYNGGTKLENKQCNMQPILDLNYKKTFANSNHVNGDKLDVEINGCV